MTHSVRPSGTNGIETPRSLFSTEITNSTNSSRTRAAGKKKDFASVTLVFGVFGLPLHQAFLCASLCVQKKSGNWDLMMHKDHT